MNGENGPLRCVHVHETEEWGLCVSSEYYGDPKIDSGRVLADIKDDGKQLWGGPLKIPEHPVKGINFSVEEINAAYGRILEQEQKDGKAINAIYRHAVKS